ncbi:MAG TPA: phosphoglycerate kinase [Candidatus Saccharibacteria bacterium]|nr:phosphoglycerate kinase [Candidatus Saccharibacteria bacterium]
MGLHKKTIKDVSLSGKTVLVSVDYNVPAGEHGEVLDDYRIRMSMPTLQYLLDQDCKVVLISHRGRPDGKVEPNLSLKKVAESLEKLVKREVLFVDDCVGPKAENAKKTLRNKQILMLENTRFYAQEEANDKSFAQQLASGVDYFVQDAFGNAHRSHASTDAITNFVPSVAGLLIENEYKAVTDVILNPDRPLTAIVGGAKIADKIDVLKTFIKTADLLAIGGAMASTFLDAKGVEVGKSLVDEDEIDTAKHILDLAEAESKKRPFVFYLPQDVVVADKIDKHAKTRIVDFDAHVIADIESYPRQPRSNTRKIRPDELILDIGPFSGAFIAGSIQYAKTVIWNGLMGVTETPSINGPVGPFAHGTELILDALCGQFGNRPYSLIGGGDTSAYIEERGLVKCSNHVSTGGGATLDLLAGKKLPGIEALQDK